MTKVNIPDPLEVQVKALDNAFYEWAAGNDKINNDPDAYEYWVKRWEGSAHEPFVYTADEIYENWGDDIEEFVATNNLAVDKANSDEILRKVTILQEINEDCPHCLDGTCTSLEHGD
jgi:hypothetical protein